MLTSRHLIAIGFISLSLACSSTPGAPGGTDPLIPSTGLPSAGDRTSSDTDTAGCADDAEFFRTKLWEPVMSVQCITCHNAQGIASGTRMVLVPPTEAGAVDTNFKTVRGVARVLFDGTSLLLLKPSGKHPLGHGGGTLLSPDSARYADFRTFTERVRGVPGACDSGASTQTACTAEGLDSSAQRQLRMLTRFEYDNTLSDLLYLDTPSTWGQALPAEEVANGFDNAAVSRTVGSLLTDKLLAASEQAAAAAVAKLSRHVSCSPGAACALRYIQDFGARAFRAPLEDAEVARYQTLYTSVAAEDGYLEGLKAVTSAMLLSPRFLYRSELGAHQGGGRYALSDYEVASELSYLFWGSMPDDALFTQARQGLLHTPDQVAAEARRLLASSRSRSLLNHFVSQWMDLDRVDQVQKDPLVLANFSPELRTAMKAETLDFFDYVVRTSGGRLADLFSSNYTFASDALATFYGLSTPLAGVAASSGARQWTLKNTGRGGLLTQGAILAAQATPQAPSPVRRGKLVRERLLCQPLPAAPPGLNLELGASDTAKTNRERFQAHSTNAACSSCHQMMDPIGFGFEQFDSVGRYKPQMVNGDPVDASGEVRVSKSTDGTFMGVAGLQEKLAGSRDVEDCYSLQWLRFAYGVSGEDNSCAATQLTDRFHQNGLNLSELLISLTQLPRFTQRWGPTDALPEPTGTPPTTGGGTTSGGTTSGGTTSGGTTSGGTTSGGTTTPPPPPAGGLQVAETVQSDWGTGYCHNVKVTNTGTSALTWHLSLTITGTLTNFWSAVTTVSGAQVNFVGEDWNSQLPAGGSTTFGYCAKR